MKKTISLAIVLAFILSIVSLLNISIFTSKADTLDNDIYNETNTYDVDEIKENVKIETADPVKYEENQYTITYNMNSKIDRAVAEHPSVTVFTHGYNSSAKDWSNTNAKEKDQFDFAYNKNSLVNKVAELYGENNYTLLWAKMEDYKSFKLVNLTNCKGSYRALSKVHIAHYQQLLHM